MRLFILLSRFPYPLEKGDKLRAFAQIKELSKSNEIILCTLSTERISKQQKEQLAPYCKQIHIIRLHYLSILLSLLKNLFFTNLPLQLAYFYNQSTARKIKRIIQKGKIDHIFCQLIRTSEYVKNINLPKTLDYMDSLSKGMERRVEQTNPLFKPLIRIEAQRLKKYQHHILKYFDSACVISAQDQNDIIHLRNKEIAIIPNGVDQTFYVPHLTTEKDIDILFTGNMNYTPNIDCVEYIVTKVMPLIWKVDLNIKLYIVGASPNKRVRNLSSDKVIVTGWVDDTRDYYKRAKVFLAPLRIGSGLQNKLLEAMCMKVPTITSNLANNALSAKENEEILIGRTPEEYKEYVVRLLSNPKERERLSENAYLFVTKNYNWSNTTEQLNKLIRGSVKTN